MKKIFDVNDEKQSDQFNELYTQACEKLDVPRETMTVSFDQAATILEVSPVSVKKWAYSKPALLELVFGATDTRRRAVSGVTLDSVIIRLMTKAKTPSHFLKGGE